MRAQLPEVRQQSLFTDFFGAPELPPVPGLQLERDYLSAATEAELAGAIDAAVWESRYQRRTQSYGLGYRDERLVDRPLPDWLQPLAARVHADGKIGRVPEQAGINEYLPGQGIAPHVDDPTYGNVVIVSLLGDCLFELHHPDGERYELHLPRRSCLVLADEARRRWRHGIAARSSDAIDGVRVARTRRVSVTFRVLKQDWRRPGDGGDVLPASVVPIRHRRE